MAGVVALDIGRRGLRGVQVDGAYSNRPKITRFGAVGVTEGTVFDGEITDERRGAAAIKQLWKSAGFTTNKVAFGIGNRKVVVREMTLPAMPAAQRKSALRFAVEGHIPIDLDDSILDFLPLRAVTEHNEPRHEGLLVATARASLESTVNAIEKAGRSIDAVDFSGFSLLRTLSNANSGTQAIINIGAASTTVVIATGSMPEFVRMVPSGGDDVTHAIERALSIPFAEAEIDKINRGLQGGATSAHDIEAETVLRENVAALIDSIRNTLNFYAGAHPERPIAQVLLTGGGSRLMGLAPVLTRALGVPTVHGDPLAAFSVSSKVRASGVENWALELAAPLGVTVGEK